LFGSGTKACIVVYKQTFVMCLYPGGYSLINIGV